MKKVYNKELGIHVTIDPITREQVGSGLFDTIFSQTAKQIAAETIKKSATAALVVERPNWKKWSR